MYLDDHRESIPFEYRPVTKYKNTSVRTNSKTLPNSYMLDENEGRLSLIFDFEIREYTFDDSERLKAEVTRLANLGIRRISIGYGLLKITLISVALFALVLFLSLFQ